MRARQQEVECDAPCEDVAASSTQIASAMSVAYEDRQCTASRGGSVRALHTWSPGCTRKPEW